MNVLILVSAMICQAPVITPGESSGDTDSLGLPIINHSYAMDYVRKSQAYNARIAAAQRQSHHHSNGGSSSYWYQLPAPPITRIHDGKVQSRSGRR